MQNLEHNRPFYPYWNICNDWAFCLSGSFSVKEINDSARAGLGKLVPWNLNEPWSLLQIASQSLIDFLKEMVQSGLTDQVFEQSNSEFLIAQKTIHLKCKASFRRLEENQKVEIYLFVQDQTEFFQRERMYELYVNKMQGFHRESRDVYFTYNHAEKKISYLSESIEKYTGSTTEEIESNQSLFWNKVHPEDRDSLAEFLSRETPMIGSSIFRFESQVKSTVWFQVFINPLIRSRTKMDGILTEITRQKEQTEKINYYERVISSFLFTSPVFLALVEPHENELIFHQMSISQGQYYGLSINQLRNKKIRQLTPSGKSIDLMLPHFEEARRSLKPVKFEIEPEVQGDETIYYTINYLQSTPSGNQMYTLIGVPRSLSHHLGSEEAYDKQILRHLMEDIPIMIWTTNRQLVFQSIIGHGLDYLDYSCEFFVGKNIEEIYSISVTQNSPLNTREVIERYKNVLLGNVEQFDLACSGRYLRCHLRPLLDEKKVIVGVLGHSLDITEFHEEELAHKQLNKKMQESQRLESLGLLAGGVAHDYNNLLTGITASLSLIQSSNDVPAEIQESLMQIEASSQQMVGLTSHMLSYSGRSKQNLQSLNLNELIEDSLSMIRSLFRGKSHTDIVIEKHLTEYPLFVRVDETQIQQVILNLLTNAREAIVSGSGTIRITTRKQKFTEEALSRYDYREKAEPGAFAKLIIEDTGVGMTEDVRQRIFEPFYTTKFTGRGLGLSSVLGIIKSHNGLLRVESEIGKGSRFFVSLPISEESSSKRYVRSTYRPITPLPIDLRAGRVLVVDDEQMILDIAEKVLKKLGFNSMSAKSGEEALKLFETSADEISIILLDVTMPRMRGSEVLAELHKRGFNKPVILMSGFSEGEIRDKLPNGMPIHFLGKPFRVEDLKAALIKITDLPK